MAFVSELLGLRGGQCGLSDSGAALHKGLAAKGGNQGDGWGGLWDLFRMADSCHGDNGGCKSQSRRTDVYNHGNLEKLLQELFYAHDLNKNGVLEELELVQLNKKIALLHHGKDVNLEEVKEKYQTMFRQQLSVEGQPVPWAVFRRYMFEVLEDLDPGSINSQEMIVEQWLTEARAARMMFHMPSMASVSDAPFLSTISFDEETFRQTVQPSRWDFVDDSQPTPLNDGSPVSKMHDGASLELFETASTAASFSMSPGRNSHDFPESEARRSSSFVLTVRQQPQQTGLTAQKPESLGFVCIC
mmetsp:Transcript_64015/g.103519  ORF Transcript_64015/g.103519 Transcript_64015/m.103519 type:complete len:301 (+) Transcript_64015:32-934(+)